MDGRANMRPRVIAINCQFSIALLCGTRSNARPLFRCDQSLTCFAVCFSCPSVPVCLPVQCAGADARCVLGCLFARQHEDLRRGATRRAKTAITAATAATTTEHSYCRCNCGPCGCRCGFQSTPSARLRLCRCNAPPAAAVARGADLAGSGVGTPARFHVSNRG
jgi:hypothetical protein